MTPARRRTGRARRAFVSTAWGVVLAAGAGCADAPRPRPTAPAVCRIDTTVGTEKAAKDRAFPAQYWFVLLVSGYQSSGEIARPARDCRGIPATMSHDTCGADVAVEREPQPLTAADLHVTHLGGARRLVWVETTHLSDGRSEGPVALVDVEDAGLAVRALGTLRSYRENVSLRLVPMNGGTVLVAEGERCETLRTRAEDGSRPRACDRAVRVVPLLGDRFTDGPVLDDAGRCLESGFILMRGAGAAADGARYELDGSVTFAPDAVTVREQLALSEPRDRAADGGNTFVTRVQAERRLTLRGGRLVATEPRLLTKWLARHGGMR